MTDWRLIGPKIPQRVWKSRFLRALGLDDPEHGIRWAPMPDRGAAWEALDARRLGPNDRVLLLIHGTGQPTREGFLGFTPAEFAGLRAAYGDRILAFDHRALGHQLSRNLADFCGALTRAGVSLKFDVLGLSRGGLLARLLAEGWAQPQLGDRQVEVHKLIFIGTPNGGTPSARRDPWGVGATLMRSWRVDVRRVALVNQREREVELATDPFAIAPYAPEPDRRPWLLWPFLYGSHDQLPGSPALARLNGFAGPSPGGVQRPAPTYYGVASSFGFDHGAPDPVLVRLRGRELRRSDVVHWALPVANDLVIPTASVYAPPQGEHSPGLFPLPPERLMVLGPASNATHVGLMRVAAVRARVLGWLAGG